MNIACQKEGWVGINIHKVWIDAYLTLTAFVQRSYWQSETPVYIYRQIKLMWNTCVHGCNYMCKDVWLYIYYVHLNAYLRVSFFQYLSFSLYVCLSLSLYIIFRYIQSKLWKGDKTRIGTQQYIQTQQHGKRNQTSKNWCTAQRHNTRSQPSHLQMGF